MVRLVKDLIGNSRIEKGILLKKLDFSTIDGYVDLIGITLSVLQMEVKVDKSVQEILDSIFLRILRIADSRKRKEEGYEEYIKRVLYSDYTGCVDYTKYKDKYLFIPEESSQGDFNIKDYMWYLNDTKEDNGDFACLESLKRQISGTSVSRSVIDGAYLSFDNLDIEFVSTYNILTGIIMWVLNSSSVRKGTLQLYDKFEIEYQLGMVDEIYFSPLRRVG